MKYLSSFFICIFLIISSIQISRADKLDDLGMTREGKPVISKVPVIEGQYIQLIDDQSRLVTIQRPSLNLPVSASVKSKAIAIMNLVISGPTDEEIKQGYKSIFPEGTKLTDIEINAMDFAIIKMDIPTKYINDPNWVESNFDLITHSIIRSLQELPIVSFHILLRDPDTGDYNPIDQYLPLDIAAEVDTTPDTGSPVIQENKESPIQAKQYPRPGGTRPTGSLSNKAVYLNPGHGWVWRDSDYWGVQRSFVHNNIEDFSNVDMVNQWLAMYCYNAGADVFSVREMDFNTNMVIVDNDDGGPGYVETGTGWTNSSLAGFANGHIPYTNGQDPFSYGTNRLNTCITGSPTATATWTPTIPASGWYNVYVSHAAFSNRSPQAHYRIYHAGGQTDYYLDQRMRRFTWIFIGNYYFETGFNSNYGKVVLFNDSNSASHYISADAVRFGGGMGVVSRGATGTSGKARKDEEARYNIQFGGYSGYDGSGDDESDGWSHRPRYGRWQHQSAAAYGASTQNAVFISSHTNAGGGTGLGTFVYTGYDGTWHDTFRNYIHDEVLNDIHNGYSTGFNNHGTGKKYGTYGENNPSNVSDLMPIVLGEWLFHDSSADMALYHDPKFRQMMGRAVYQGIVKFWANRNSTPVYLLPEPPRNFRARQLSTTSIQLSWDASQTDGQGIRGDAATGYKIYMGTHGRGFNPGSPVSGTSTTLTSLSPGSTYYFYITATNYGGESFPSETMAVKLATGPSTPKILIINGFDKFDISSRVITSWSGDTLYRQYVQKMNTLDYIVEHAKAIGNYPNPIAFDSCEDEAVELGYITLSNYAAVIWIGGIQSEVSTTDPTNDSSITSSQQTLLTNYLNGGGKLFISGSEIAWDLDRSGGTTFVDNVLKANYSQDNSGYHAAFGEAGSIFASISTLNFDDGSGSTYAVNWPDAINPTGGSISALEYGSAGGMVTMDNFSSSGGWQDPNYSGQTNADAACTFSITNTPTYLGSGAGDLYYVWGTGSFIREYNSSLPQFPAASNFSIWIYGDNSGHQIRLCFRDGDSDLFVNNYLTLNFTGWQEFTWNDIANNPGTFWAGSGNGTLTGPTLRFDSIHINKVSGVASGHIYFDEATYTPTSGGGPSGPVAAVQYSGTYKLIYMGFPFETIHDSSKRNSVMTNVLDFFNLDNVSVPDWQDYSLFEDPPVNTLGN